MFDFGRPEDTAELFWQESLNMLGPKVPDVHYSEMSKRQLETFFIYVYAALAKAYRAGASAEVIQYLTEQYDEIFVYFAEVSPKFRNFVDRGGHIPLPGRFPDAVKKYRELAKLPPLAN